ncbi:GNAT family N-acetyltransferase [Marinivivus vitaminiproducens]|uniref:GNAT family N-acetyltransferase n=1 Tax=Marinivivus vitaminiproducens TaxID=3035935 RepID=UPI0027A4D131|nr:GNAT family N-acetyltransferase [Geminicoccaceae bacterium SCSIO 64248]
MTDGAVAIRRYRLEDAAATLAVFRSAVHEGAARDYTQAQRAAWAPAIMDETAWASRRAAKPGWVAEIDGAVVGFTDLEPDGHIDMLFVAARFHRRGVAAALYRAVEHAARDAGLARLTVEASLTARPFFERQGFSVTTMQNKRLRGQVLTNCRMERLFA